MQRTLIRQILALALVLGVALSSLPARAQSSIAPSRREREYEKLRRDAFKKYHDPGEASFKRDVDDACQQRRREHSEYALAINLGSASSPTVTRRRDKLDVEDALYENPLIQDYVNRLGQSIVPSGSEHTYSFKVVLSPFPEARSLSTGAIYLSTGLLSLVDNEAQLAYILGHEIAHIEKNHWFDDVLVDQLVDRRKDQRRKTTSILKYIAFQAAKPFSGWIGVDPLYFRLYAKYGLPSLVKLASPKTLTAWDRVQEDEADRAALQYMLDRRYDAREVRNLYANLFGASREESSLQYGFTATSQRIVERAQSTDGELRALRSILPKPTSTGADLAVRRQQSPELAARDERARRELALLITGAANKEKAFHPTPAGWRTIEQELRGRAEKSGSATGAFRSAGEFAALMAIVKRDNAIRSYQADLFRIARAQLTEALLLRNDDPVAHLHQGIVWRQTARGAADARVATEAFRRAVSLDRARQLPEARLQLALSLLNSTSPERTSGSHAEAHGLLKEYVRIYKSLHQGAPPPDMQTVASYLRDAGASRPAPAITAKRPAEPSPAMLPVANRPPLRPPSPQNAGGTSVHSSLANPAQGKRRP
ncbi:MAG: M48 family metalloprotease [Blastocatellia bacterium]|nr:M48 family metalloprotease [Blastocatellia bacterium]